MRGIRQMPKAGPSSVSGSHVDMNHTMLPDTCSKRVVGQAHSANAWVAKAQSVSCTDAPRQRHPLHALRSPSQGMLPVSHSLSVEPPDLVPNRGAHCSMCIAFPTAIQSRCGPGHTGLHSILQVSGLSRHRHSLRQQPSGDPSYPHLHADATVAAPHPPTHKGAPFVGLLSP